MKSKVGAIAALGLSFASLAGTNGQVKIIDLGPTMTLDVAGYGALIDHGELAGYTFPADSPSRAAYTGHVTAFGSLGGDYAHVGGGLRGERTAKFSDRRTHARHDIHTVQRGFSQFFSLASDGAPAPRQQRVD